MSDCSLISQVLGAVGALPGIFVKLEVSYYLLKRLLGVRTEGDKKAAKVQKLTKNEVNKQHPTVINIVLSHTGKPCIVVIRNSMVIVGAKSLRVKRL